MITNSRVFVTKCHDPHVNLAREDVLLRTSPPGRAALFLWQNAHTVVIGAGQNAWRECDTELLKKENGTLARRSSGGGAVYHDLGNLNFSFVVPREDYDVKRQLNVVLKAVRYLGINAEPTGRNDITVDGAKFSGNAFRLLKTSALHHGTVLVSSDMSVIGRYLHVSKEKLKSKGVKSVASRVINLSSVADVDVETVKNSLIRAFCEEYFICPAENIEDVKLDDLDAVIEKFRDWNWIMGASPAGEVDEIKRFDWGETEVSFRVVSGKLEDVGVFTDSMDEGLALRLKNALNGARYEPDDIKNRIYACVEGKAASDLAGWLTEGM